jgi:hypothetical protein
VPSVALDTFNAAVALYGSHESPGLIENEIEDCHPPTPPFLDSEEAFEFNGESEDSADENEEAQSSTDIHAQVIHINSLLILISYCDS